MLSLDQNKMLKFLCEEIQELLKGEPTETISLHKFPGEYHKKFGRQLKLKPFGFSKLMELLDALPPNMIQVYRALDGFCIFFPLWLGIRIHPPYPCLS